MKKRILICSLATAIMLSLAACSQTTAQTAGGSMPASQAVSSPDTKEIIGRLDSPEDVTADYVINATTPSKVTDVFGILGVTTRYTNTGDAAMEGACVSAVYRKLRSIMR